MLDEKNVLWIDQVDLGKLCILASLDLQMDEESYEKDISYRGNMC